MKQIVRNIVCIKHQLQFIWWMWPHVHVPWDETSSRAKTFTAQLKTLQFFFTSLWSQIEKKSMWLFLMLLFLIILPLDVKLDLITSEHVLGSSLLSHMILTPGKSLSGRTSLFRLWWIHPSHDFIRCFCGCLRQEDVSCYESQTRWPGPPSAVLHRHGYCACGQQEVQVRWWRWFRFQWDVQSFARAATLSSEGSHAQVPLINGGNKPS